MIGTKVPSSAQTTIKAITRDSRLFSTILPFAAGTGSIVHVSFLERNGNVDGSIATGRTEVAAGGWNFPFSRFMSTTSPLASDVSSLIDNNKVVIFSKSYCPYCSATKKVFQDLKVDGVVVVELDRDAQGPEIQEELLRKTGQSTVPNVFVGGVHLGGNSDTQAALKSGKLKEMLN